VSKSKMKQTIAKMDKSHADPMGQARVGGTFAVTSARDEIAAPVVHGQAGQVVIMPRGLYIQIKILDGLASKRTIAEHVATKYVKDFDAVLLDAGSTAELIAEEMFARRRFLSVLTNNMGAYASYTGARALSTEGSSGEQLSENASARGSLLGNELLITGGRYVDTYEALLGDGTIASFESFTPNITIIGISGLRWEEGVFCHGAEEAQVKKLLWTKATDIRMIATDWSKIGKRDAHVFGRLEEVGMNAKEVVLVTCNPPDDISASMREEFEGQMGELKKTPKIKIIRLDISDGPMSAPDIPSSGVRTG
jgi:DeoR/GlpR family transcriptional regulator of sugar metabolism